MTFRQTEGSSARDAGRTLHPGIWPERAPSGIISAWANSQGGGAVVDPLDGGMRRSMPVDSEYSVQECCFL